MNSITNNEVKGPSSHVLCCHKSCSEPERHDLGRKTSIYAEGLQICQMCCSAGRHLLLGLTEHHGMELWHRSVPWQHKNPSYRQYSNVDDNAPSEKFLKVSSEVVFEFFLRYLVKLVSSLLHNQSYQTHSELFKMKSRAVE